MNAVSSNSNRHPYVRPLFWSNPENQFWRSPIYTDNYRERMQRLVAKLEKSNKVLIDLIK